MPELQNDNIAENKEANKALLSEFINMGEGKYLRELQLAMLDKLGEFALKLQKEYWEQINSTFLVAHIVEQPAKRNEGP